MGTEYLELFNEAIDNLRTSTGNDSIAICDELNKSICINGTEFYCSIKKTISNANVFSVIEEIKNKSIDKNMPIILITNKIYPKLANTFADNQINWMDKVGNCDIRHENLTIRISGQKNNALTKASTATKISETNIKLILFFLQNPESVN